MVAPNGKSIAEFLEAWNSKRLRGERQATSDLDIGSVDTAYGDGENRVLWHDLSDFVDWPAPPEGARICANCGMSYIATCATCGAR